MTLDTQRQMKKELGKAQKDMIARLALGEPRREMSTVLLQRPTERLVVLAPNRSAMEGV